MKRLLVCIGCGVFCSAALAETPQNLWLQRLEDSGARIEVIRVASKKPLIAIEETDAQIENILKEAEALEIAVSDSEKVEDSS